LLKHPYDWSFDECYVADLALKQMYEGVIP